MKSLRTLICTNAGSELSVRAPQMRTPRPGKGTSVLTRWSKRVIALALPDALGDVDEALQGLVGGSAVHAFEAIGARDHPGDVPGGRHRGEHLLALSDLDEGKIEARMRGVEVAAPLERLLQPVSGKRIEDAEPVVQLLAVIDHRALHGEDLPGLLEADGAPVVEHQIGRHHQVDVLDPLQGEEAARLAPGEPDEVVRGRIEPALRTDVDDVVRCARRCRRTRAAKAPCTREAPNTCSNCSTIPPGWLVRGPGAATPRNAVTPVSTRSSGT